MKQALIGSILSIILFTACSSNNTPQTQYYLLNSPTTFNAVVTDIEASNNRASEIKSSDSITVSLLELPDYLKQANLVLQLSDHQLHYSNFHMWAEPLQISFPRALAQDLNNRENHFQFITAPAINQTTATTLVINVTSFHATHLSQAILVGSYWMQGKTLPDQAVSHKFNLQIALNKDGYEHAVAQMRAAVSQLAKEISDSLATE